MPCQRDGLVQRAAMRRIVYSGALTQMLLTLAFPGVAIAAGVPNGILAHRREGGRANLRLRRTAVRPDRVAAASAGSSGSTGPGTRIQHCGSVSCGPNYSRGLQAADIDHWESGWLYNPDDGKTYPVRAKLRSVDTFVARIYLGIPLFGETWTLLRVPRLSSEGWC